MNADFETKSVISETKLLGRGGLEITGKDEKVYAKEVIVDGRQSYYIKVYNHEIYDPLGQYANRERYLDSAFKQVSKTTFDFYVLYLSTNKAIYLTKANRSFISK